MLSKSHRVNLSLEFKTISAGRRSETTNLKFYYQIENHPFARIGIALSKNYFKKAYLRNKARRIVSQAIQEIYNDLPKNINLIIMPKTGVINTATEQLKIEIIKCLKNF